MVRAIHVQQVTFLVAMSVLCSPVCSVGGTTGSVQCRRRLSFKTTPSSAQNVLFTHTVAQMSAVSVKAKVQLQKEMKVALRWYAYWWRKNKFSAEEARPTGPIEGTVESEIDGLFPSRSSAADVSEVLSGQGTHH